MSQRHLTVMRSISRLHWTPLGLAVVVTIAVSTAACTVVAALVDATLLRPPPFRDVDRLAILYMTEQSPRYGGGAAALVVSPLSPPGGGSEAIAVQ